MGVDLWSLAGRHVDKVALFRYDHDGHFEITVTLAREAFDEVPGEEHHAICNGRDLWFKLLPTRRNSDEIQIQTREPPKQKVEKPTEVKA